MSDVSETNELIAESRKFLFSDSWYRYEDTVEGDLICRLADALEAATRVPVQGEPNAKVILRGSDTDCASGVCMKGCSHLMWFCDTCSCEGGWGMVEDRLTVIAGEHVCPPPLEVQGEPNEGADFRLARSRGYSALAAERDFTGHMDEGRRTAYYEGFKLGRKHPQPDAATDAIAAVNALHEPFEAGGGRQYCGECSGAAGSGNLRPWPCPTRKALDGEPEPEWEYGTAMHMPVAWKGGSHCTSEESREAAELRVASAKVPAWLTRRRKAGPWLLVEGESKP